MANSKKKNSKKKNMNKNVANKNIQKNVKEENINEYMKKDNNKKNEDEQVKKVQIKKDTINKAKRELVYAESGDDEMGKLLKIVLIVTAIIIVFYFVTSFVTRKASESKNSKSSEKTVIQYNDLIIGSMLNKDGEYYVLIEKDDDEYLSEYESSIQMIGINEEAPKIYIAKLNDSFNKGYLADEANYDSDLGNFKVSGTTLIKVSNHSISETFDNHDDISSKLEGLQ